MGRTRQTGQARLVGVLAVLLGLFAMHGLASSHHAAAAVPLQVMPLAATAQPHDDLGVSTAGHASASGAAVTPASGDLSAASAPAGPLCHDDCPDSSAVLCVTVLTGAAAAVALHLHRRTQGQPRQADPPCQARAPTTTGRQSAPPDPVTELCVSRT